MPELEKVLLLTEDTLGAVIWTRMSVIEVREGEDGGLAETQRRLGAFLMEAMAVLAQEWKNTKESPVIRLVPARMTQEDIDGLDTVTMKSAMGRLIDDVERTTND